MLIDLSYLEEKKVAPSPAPSTGQPNEASDNDDANPLGDIVEDNEGEQDNDDCPRTSPARGTKITDTPDDDHEESISECDNGGDTTFYPESQAEGLCLEPDVEEPPPSTLSCSARTCPSYILTADEVDTDTGRMNHGAGTKSKVSENVSVRDLCAIHANNPFIAKLQHKAWIS